MYVIVTSQVITGRYMDLTHEMHFMYKFYTMSFRVGMSCKSCHYRAFSVLPHVVRLYVYSLKVKVHILQVVYMHFVYILTCVTCCIHPLQGDYSMCIYMHVCVSYMLGVMWYVCMCHRVVYLTYGVHDTLYIYICTMLYIPRENKC